MFRNVKHKVSNWRQRHPRRSQALAIAIPIAVVAIGFGLFAGFNESGKDTSKPGTTQSRDPLEPASTLRFGQTRIVSACQALSPQIITDIYGTPQDTGAFTEQYVDTSIDTSRPLETSCSYANINDRTKVAGGLGTIKLTVNHYKDSASITTPLRVGSSTEGALQILQSAADASNNQRAKDFAKLLTESEKTFADSDEKLANVDKPEDLALFMGTANAIWFTRGSVSYELDLGSRLNTKVNDQTELAESLATASRTFDAVEKNVEKRDLSQAPAKTVFGSQDKIGSTKVLEPCLILSDEVGTMATGAQKSQDSIQHRSMPFKTNINNSDNSADLPSTSCIRDYTTEYSVEDASALFPKVSSTGRLAFLQLTIAPDSKAAQTWAEQKYPNGRVVESDADWTTAISLNRPSEGNTQYVFRKGAYVGLVNLYARTTKDTFDSTYSYDNEEKNIKFVNELVANIKD